MGDFYGYNAGQFKKDYSYVGNALNIAASTVQKIPEAMELDKALQEGRVNNDSIYEALKEQTNSMGDEEFRTLVGEDKKTFLSTMKPRRNEGEEYLKRSVSAVSKLKPYYEKQGVQQATSAIGAMNAPAQQYQADVAEVSKESPEFADMMKSAGGFAKGPSFAKPEDVQKVARGYNVPVEKLAPEMKEATNQLTAEQLGKVSQSQTQFGAMKGIGGGVTPETGAAIGTLPNEVQEANTMIQTSEAQSRAIGAEASKTRAQADLEGARNDATKLQQTAKQQKLNNAKSYQANLFKAMDDKQAAFDKLNDDLKYTVDENTKNDLLKQQAKLKKDMERLDGDIFENNKVINEIEGTKLQTSKPHESTQRILDEFQIGGDSDKKVTAAKIVSAATDYGFEGRDYNKILTLLANGAKAEDILDAMVKRKGTIGKSKTESIE